MSHGHPVTAMCEVLAVSHSGYCQWRSGQSSARAIQTEAIMAKSTGVHEASRGT